MSEEMGPRRTDPEQALSDEERADSDPDQADSTTPVERDGVDIGDLHIDTDAVIETTGTILKDVGITLLVALLLLPLAALWGIGNARTTDYLGPHRTDFAVDYSGEFTLDLGPLGEAYLPNDMLPDPLQVLGIQVDLGTITNLQGDSLLSEETLSAYLTLVDAPEEGLRGIAEELAFDALRETAKAEVVLLLLALVWTQRRRFLSRTVGAALTPLRMFGAWLIALVLVGASILVPPEPPEAASRYPISLAQGDLFDGLTVDNQLLAALLNQGISGLELLAQRQQEAIDEYIAAATTSMSGQFPDLMEPDDDEVLLLGFSDLHCSLAMTEVIRRLSARVQPDVVVSSGDDTMNGTAAERACVTREREIGSPFVVATGNHDSDITEAQMRRAGMEVLDGEIVPVNGINFLGDDDPEYNIPFSVNRVKDRPESEEEMAARLLGVADDSDVDVMLVHQPAAAKVITAQPDPPMKLLMWGHFHTELGPDVIQHQDGSWTVAMQAGTAGGVLQPTITSFSTPFSPPRKEADVYLFSMHKGTKLITRVQPVRFLPSGEAVVEEPFVTGDVDDVPAETRERLGDEDVEPTPQVSPGGPTEPGNTPTPGG